MKVNEFVKKCLSDSLYRAILLKFYVREFLRERKLWIEESIKSVIGERLYSVEERHSLKDGTLNIDMNVYPEIGLEDIKIDLKF